MLSQCARVASAARLARVYGTVVQDQHHRPLLIAARFWLVALVKDRQKRGEIRATLGPAGVDKGRDGPIENAEQGHFGGLAGCRNAQIGAFLGSGVRQIGMRQRFRPVARTTHTIERKA